MRTWPPLSTSAARTASQRTARSIWRPRPASAPGSVTSTATGRRRSATWWPTIRTSPRRRIGGTSACASTGRRSWASGWTISRTSRRTLPSSLSRTWTATAATTSITARKTANGACSGVSRAGSPMKTALSSGPTPMTGSVSKFCPGAAATSSTGSLPDRRSFPSAASSTSSTRTETNSRCTASRAASAWKRAASRCRTSSPRRRAISPMRTPRTWCCSRSTASRTST